MTDDDHKPQEGAQIESGGQESETQGGTTTAPTPSSGGQTQQEGTHGVQASPQTGPPTRQHGRSTSAGAASGSAMPSAGSSGLPGTGTQRARPQHKIKRDRRLLSYVNHEKANDTTDGGNSEHNMAIEAAARDAVCKYEIARGRTPQQMKQTFPGYDIVSRDLVRGTQRLIEVKGVAGEWNRTGVGLSRLQFTNAQEYPEQYWLYVVEFVSDPPRMRIHPIAKPATQVTSFMFDTNWRAVVDEEPIDPAIVFKRGVRVKHLTWGYGRIADVIVH